MPQLDHAPAAAAAALVVVAGNLQRTPLLAVAAAAAVGLAADGAGQHLLRPVRYSLAALRGRVAGAGASLFTDGASWRAWDAGLHRPTLGGLGNAHHDRWPGHAGAGLDERCSDAEAAETAAILKQNPTNGGTATPEERLK